MISKRNRRGGAALAIALAGAVAMPGLALADIVTNDVTSTATGKVLTVAAGSSTSVAYVVYNTNSNNSTDPQNSCNPADSTALTITASGLPAGAPAAQATVTRCEASVGITFSVPSSAAAGDYAITHTLADAGTGTYANHTNFTLRVTAPPAPTDAAAPTTTVTASVPSGAVGGYVSGTWTNETVTVSLSASDDDGGSGVQEIRYTTDGTTPSKTSGTVYSEALSFDSDGITTIEYAAVDNDGNVEAVQSFVVKVDKTAPSVAPGDVIETGWRNSSLSETFTAEDLGSGLADMNDASFSLAVADDSADPTTPTTNSRTVTDNAGNSTVRTLSALIDTVAPSITDLGPTTVASGGWYTTAVENEFQVQDVLSGLASSVASPLSLSTGMQEGRGLTVSSGSFSDQAGNTAAGVTSAAFDVDLSDPTNVQFVGGPAAGSSHYFGTVPTVPSCTADDAVSGIASCAVSGHSTSPGTHTLTATATDNAGRSTTATRTYTVLKWNTGGFYSPVDMGKVTNSVKGGSTVPLKFEVFAGVAPAGELTTLQAIGATLKVTKITCDTAAAIDEIEVLASGSTSLRYDTTAGQFIYNWKTPTGSACYRTSVTLADGSVIQADFKTR